jgi:hypothetical protein
MAGTAARAMELLPSGGDHDREHACCATGWHLVSDQPSYTMLEDSKAVYAAQTRSHGYLEAMSNAHFDLLRYDWDQ